MAGVASEVKILDPTALHSSRLAPLMLNWISLAWAASSFSLEFSIAFVCRSGECSRDLVLSHNTFQLRRS